MHSLGDVWHPGSGVPCFGGFAAFAAFGGSQSHFLPYIFLIFMHSLGDVWHPYLNAFLRWRLASWLWGSLFRRFCSFCSLWGLTVALSSLFRRFCSFCSLWGLTVSLSSLYIFPIFMHSLGDVWHPGSGVPCFGGFAAFAAFGGSQSHFLPYIFLIFMHSLGDVWHPYLNAFLRWRLASWLWGSLFRRFCSFCSLWGLTVALSSLFRRFCSFCSLWGLTVSLSSLYIFPIFMHSLGDVWHPGSGSLFRRFCSFCSLWGLTVSLSSLYLPYLHAFLRWRLASWLWGSLSYCIPQVTFRILALGFPVSEVLQLLQPLGAHSLTFFPISSLSSCIP